MGRIDALTVRTISDDLPPHDPSAACIRARQMDSAVRFRMAVGNGTYRAGVDITLRTGLAHWISPQATSRRMLGSISSRRNGRPESNPKLHTRPTRSNLQALLMDQHQAADPAAGVKQTQ